MENEYYGAMMINKYEAVGIFISIGILAIVLAMYRFGAFNFEAFSEGPALNEQGAVVVDSMNESGREEALNYAVSGTGISRLIIEDVRLGDGAVVEEGDTLVVDYVGTTEDGVQFDSSYVRGEPFEFRVGEGRVIEGWEKGVIGMKVGGKRILVIPSEMAYGNRQVGPIPPNSPLVFAIELLEIR